MQQKYEVDILSREATEREKCKKDESLVEKIQKIGDTMKQVLPKMPDDIMEVPLYLETIENF